jgi:serine/threonine-protein kinase
MVWQKGYKLQGGRYVIEKVLGEGGFGITYQAQHTLLKQWVVIKTPNEILKNDSEYPNYVKRFIQEGRKLAQLSQQPHPNIVRVTELFEDGKTYCLVMDFVPGESLFNLVQKKGSLSELEAVGYIKQIGEALIFVHHQGLVHRDAHPGNIMVQKNGKAVLIDFGIAGEIMPQDGYFTSDHPANIAFAPYEQMGGNRQVTIDVYTLAASLYYAVTGKRPESSLDRKLYNKPLISPNKYVVGISNESNLAILKGMNLEAGNRPQSMREWLKLLPDVSNEVYQVSQKIEHQAIRNEKTFPVIVDANKNGKIHNIPWDLLKLMGLCYSIMGFSLASSPWYYSAFACFLGLNLAFISALILVLNKPLTYFSSTWYIAFLLKWALQMVLSLPVMLAILGPIFLSIGSIEGKGEGSIAGLAGIIIFCINIVLIFIYVPITKKLENYLSKLHQFLILLSTSWLGIFLGWLFYQIFPVFTLLS